VTFGQSVMLLVLTAVLTGLLVPIVKSFVDAGTLKRQKESDAERARQASVIDAQIQLLDELASVLWGHQKMLLRITYYATTGNREKHDEAFRAYDDQSWDSLGSLLALISKTRWLASSEIQGRLEQLYLQLVGEVDGGILRLREADAGRDAMDTAGWRVMANLFFGELRMEIEAVLTSLAQQLRLATSHA
jgi:hypothetical protein